MIPRLSPTRLENIYLSVPKSIDRVVECVLAKYEAPQIITQDRLNYESAHSRRTLRYFQDRYRRESGLANSLGGAYFGQSANVLGISLRLTN